MRLHTHKIVARWHPSAATSIHRDCGVPGKVCPACHPILEREIEHPADRAHYPNHEYDFNKTGWWVTGTVVDEEATMREHNAEEMRLGAEIG